MNFLFYLKKYWKEVIIGMEIILIITLIVLLYNKRNCQNEIVQSTISHNITEVEEVKIEEEKIEEVKTIKVDIKGAVKKPGVYELKENSIVQDAIKAAGGLKSNATTTNINLSKKLSDEAVIKVYTTTELKKNEESTSIKECVTNKVEISDCDTPIIESTTNTENKNDQQEATKKISINTATKEELMQLNGIGESKAISIIDYRTNTKKFETIEDIKNVSGIGEAAFDKIKDFITI